MMTSVSGTTITMTKGDTLRVQISLEMDDTAYTPVEGDVVRLYVKRAKLSDGEYVDTEPLITKIVPIETMILELEPDDTSSLASGKYAYDLEITFLDGSVDTFINNASLVLVREVG